jgi:hypothetical protein
MNRVELGGKSQGKGRNGYFQLHSVKLMNIPSDPDGQVLHTDFYPRRRVNCVGPTRLLHSVEDATKLAHFFGEAVESRPSVANIEHGELVCECGHRGTPSRRIGVPSLSRAGRNRRRHDHSERLGWIEPSRVGRWRRLLVDVRWVREASSVIAGAAYRLEIVPRVVRRRAHHDLPCGVFAAKS